MIRTVLFAACVAVFAQTALAAPKVVSSIMPVNALVGAVMEGLAVPQTLLPPGATPHAHALKPSDARMLAEADVIFWIGPELETFLEGPLETLAANARKVALIQSRGMLLFEVRTLETFEAQSEHQHDHKHDHGSEEHRHESHGHDYAEGSIDGHIWLDPANAQIMLRAIAETLIEADPANADRYRRNAEAAMAFTADTWARVDERLKPVRSLRLVTYHDAFQCFEAAFGLTNVGVVAINPEAPPGARATKRLRERI